VTETNQTYFASGGHTGTVTTESCHISAVTGSGVSLSCGGGHLLVPARASVPVTPSTGPPGPGPASAPAAARSG
jgi:hypothetical protein